MTIFTTCSEPRCSKKLINFLSRRLELVAKRCQNPRPSSFEKMCNCRFLKALMPLAVAERSIITAIISWKKAAHKVRFGGKLTAVRSITWHWSLRSQARPAPSTKHALALAMRWIQTCDFFCQRRRGRCRSLRRPWCWRRWQGILS